MLYAKLRDPIFHVDLISRHAAYDADKPAV